MRKDIVSSNQPDLNSDCEILWAKIQLKNKTKQNKTKQNKTKNMLIGSFYMPQRCNKTTQELNKSITTTTTTSTKQKQIILCGDFNCPDISWEIGNVNTCSPDRSTQQSLIDVTESAQLTQVHNSSTRESKLLDLVFTTNPTIVTHYCNCTRDIRPQHHCHRFRRKNPIPN